MDPSKEIASLKEEVKELKKSLSQQKKEYEREVLRIQKELDQKNEENAEKLGQLKTELEQFAWVKTAVTHLQEEVAALRTEREPITSEKVQFEIKRAVMVAFGKSHDEQIHALIGKHLSKMSKN